MISEQEWINQLEAWLFAVATITYWSVILRVRVRNISAGMFAGWKTFIRVTVELGAYFGLWYFAIYYLEFLRSSTDFYISIAKYLAEIVVFPSAGHADLLGLSKDQWLTLSDVVAIALAFASFIFHFVGPIRQAIWTAFTQFTQKNMSIQPVAQKRLVTWTQFMSSLTVVLTVLALIIIATLFVLGPADDGKTPSGEHLGNYDAKPLIWGVAQENISTFIEGAIILTVAVLLVILIVKPLISQVFTTAGTISKAQNRFLNGAFTALVAVIGLYIFYVYMLDAVLQFFG